MNERIQQMIYSLNEKAGVHWINEDKIKFAELIVKECMDLTHWKDFDMSVEQRIRLSVYQDIKEHFGVK